MQAVNLHEGEIERAGYFMFMYNKPYVLPDSNIMNLPFPQTGFT